MVVDKHSWQTQVITVSMVANLLSWTGEHLPRRGPLAVGGVLGGGATYVVTSEETSTPPACCLPEHVSLLSFYGSTSQWLSMTDTMRCSQWPQHHVYDLYSARECMLGGNCGSYDTTLYNVGSCDRWGCTEVYVQLGHLVLMFYLQGMIEVWHKYWLDTHNS